MSAGADTRVGAIWAQDRRGVLGADGDMLWRVPADFRHFKATTLGGAVVMGRATWESIGAALPGRLSIVLTRRPGRRAPGAVVVGSLDRALETARRALPCLGADPRDEAHAPDPRLWVIGGGDVLAQALAARAVDVVVLTTVDMDAAAGLRADGAGPERLVRAPVLDGGWRIDAGRSDPPDAWRPVSGDAAWRVDRLTRSS